MLGLNYSPSVYKDLIWNVPMAAYHVQLKLAPILAYFNKKNWLPQQRPLDPCNQKCHLWIGRPRKPHDVITSNKFHQNRSRGFRATGVRKSGTPIDLACRPYNSSALYRADCDCLMTY